MENHSSVTGWQKVVFLIQILHLPSKSDYVNDPSHPSKVKNQPQNRKNRLRTASWVTRPAFAIFDTEYKT